MARNRKTVSTKKREVFEWTRRDWVLIPLGMFIAYFSYTVLSAMVLDGWGTSLLNLGTLSLVLPTVFALVYLFMRLRGWVLSRVSRALASIFAWVFAITSIFILIHILPGCRTPAGIEYRTCDLDLGVAAILYVCSLLAGLVLNVVGVVGVISLLFRFIQRSK